MLSYSSVVVNRWHNEPRPMISSPGVPRGVRPPTAGLGGYRPPTAELRSIDQGGTSFYRPGCILGIILRPFSPTVRIYGGYATVLVFQYSPTVIILRPFSPTVHIYGGYVPVLVFESFTHCNHPRSSCANIFYDCVRGWFYWIIFYSSRDSCVSIRILFRFISDIVFYRMVFYPYHICSRIHRWPVLSDITNHGLWFTPGGSAPLRRSYAL